MVIVLVQFTKINVIDIDYCASSLEAAKINTERAESGVGTTRILSLSSR